MKAQQTNNTQASGFDYWLQHPAAGRAIFDALGKLRRVPTARDIADVFMIVPTLPPDALPILHQKWDRLGSMLCELALNCPPDEFDANPYTEAHDWLYANSYDRYIKEARSVLTDVLYNPLGEK